MLVGGDWECCCFWAGAAVRTAARRAAALLAEAEDADADDGDVPPPPPPPSTQEVATSFIVPFPLPTAAWRLDAAAGERPGEGEGWPDDSASSPTLGKTKRRGSRAEAPPPTLAAAVFWDRCICMSAAAADVDATAPTAAAEGEPIPLLLTRSKGGFDNLICIKDDEEAGPPPAAEADSAAEDRRRLAASSSVRNFEGEAAEEEEAEACGFTLSCGEKTELLLLLVWLRAESTKKGPPFLLSPMHTSLRRIGEKAAPEAAVAVVGE